MIVVQGVGCEPGQGLTVRCNERGIQRGRFSVDRSRPVVDLRTGRSIGCPGYGRRAAADFRSRDPGKQVRCVILGSAERGICSNTQVSSFVRGSYTEMIE